MSKQAKKNNVDKQSDSTLSSSDGDDMSALRISDACTFDLSKVEFLEKLGEGNNLA